MKDMILIPKAVLDEITDELNDAISFLETFEGEEEAVRAERKENLLKKLAAYTG